MKALSWLSRTLGDYDLSLPAGPTEPPRHRRTAFALATVAFLVAFWLPLWAAFRQVVVDPAPRQAGPDSVVLALIPPIGVVVGLFLLLRFSPLPPSRKLTLRRIGLVMPGRGRESSWAKQIGTGASVLVFTIIASVLAASFLGPAQYPVDWNTMSGWGRAAVTLSFGLAGFQEEILLVGVPVYLLRAAGFGWGTVIGFSCVLRISFHVYYGWTSLFLLIWAFAAVLAYIYTGNLIGIIVTHSLWNLRTVLSGVVSPSLNTAINLTVILAVVGIGFWAAVYGYRNRRRLRSLSGLQRYPC